MAEYDHTARSSFARDFSLFPDYMSRAMWHCVLHGGHVRTRPGWGIARRAAGFLLQYVLKGCGWVKTRNRQFAMGAGDLLFLNAHLPYELKTDSADPWEIYWIVFDSPLAHAWDEALQDEAHPCFHPRRPLRMIAHFKRMFHLVGRKPPAFEAYCSSTIHGIVADLFEEKAGREAKILRVPGSANEDNPIGPMPKAVRKVLQCLPSVFFRKTPLSDLVRYSGVGRSQLCALFQRYVAKSPMACLSEYRIHHAKGLLQHSSLPIKEISVQVGLEDINYFSRLFRRRTGLSPRHYRERHNRLSRSGLGPASCGEVIPFPPADGDRDVLWPRKGRKSVTHSW